MFGANLFKKVVMDARANQGHRDRHSEDPKIDNSNEN